MRIVGHALRSIGGATAEGEEAPAAPSLSIANDGTGTSVTATVAGDAGVVNTLWYQTDNASAWVEGESRAGDGSIAQTGLAPNAYYTFVAHSAKAGLTSLPSPAKRVQVIAESDQLDMLSDAADWLRDQRKDKMARTVIYAQGEVSGTVRATVGQTTFRIGQAAGPDILIRMRDYIIEAAELAALDISEPAMGDQITETVAGVARVFEVLGPGNGEPEWRWHERYGNSYRIHTKDMGAA